jgi:hypothetical protein
MAQFCTRCGKPLSSEVRFCPSCGGAVAGATMQPPDPSASSTPATPTQQAAQFTPVTGSVPREPMTSSASEDKRTTVATPVAPEISQSAPSSQVAPVDVPAARQPTRSPSPSQGWANVAPTEVPASTGRTNTVNPGQEASFSPVSFAGAPPASTSNQQWSQTTPPTSTPNQQWSQTPTDTFPPSVPLGAAGQPPRRRSVLPKLIGIALVLSCSSE